MEKIVKIDNQEIHLTHLEKVLFPESEITKQELVEYYQKAANHLLPLIFQHPISLQRFPANIEQDGFFQKDIPNYFPDWMERAVLSKKNGKVSYLLLNKASDLVYVTNQNTITLHAGLSRTDKIDYPDRIIFDIDPSDKDFTKVVWAAQELKKCLENFGLASLVQTTGSRGLHVWVPLLRKDNFDIVHRFAKSLAQNLAKLYPKDITIEQSKEKRGTRVFVDYLRNSYGQTAVIPYSVRAKEEAPIATPLYWEELEGDIKSSRQFTLRTIEKRLKLRKNPWSDILLGGSLKKGLQQLEKSS